VKLLHCPVYVCPTLAHVPAVVNVHDLFALRAPALCTRANRGHFGKMLPAALERARRIVVPTGWVRDEALDWNARREEPLADFEARLRVVPWGVDERFGPVMNRDPLEALRRRHGLPERYVLYVGRVEPKKNVRQVLEAFFAATAARSLPHGLVMAGPRGWGAERGVRRLIRNLALEPRVRRLGFVPDGEMPALYSGADALLFPSMAEGFGFPVLEAMACGTPVVATDIPPLREVAGGAAHLVPPGDLPALRLALETVLTDRMHAAELIHRGKARAATFTWRAHAEATVRLYREVLAEDAAARA
jgi:glycosyltransferase involved in cell wall biosynthesis